jgi:hypothetical protein
MNDLDHGSRLRYATCYCAAVVVVVVGSGW